MCRVLRSRTQCNAKKRCIFDLPLIGAEKNIYEKSSALNRLFLRKGHVNVIPNRFYELYMLHPVNEKRLLCNFVCNIPPFKTEGDMLSHVILHNWYDYLWLQRLLHIVL